MAWTPPCGLQIRVYTEAEALNLDEYLWTHPVCSSSRHRICYAACADSMTLFQRGAEHHVHVLYPNCAGHTRITCPQSVPMTHCPGSLRLSNRALYKHVCISWASSHWVREDDLCPNRHCVGDHFNYYSSMARRSVGQLCGAGGGDCVAMWQ